MGRTLGTSETICNALAYSEKLGKDLRPSDCIGKVVRPKGPPKHHLRPKEDWRKLHNPERNNGEDLRLHRDFEECCKHH